MTRTLLARLTLLTAILLGAFVSLRPNAHAASLQTTTDGQIEFQVTLPAGSLPLAPAFVRLLTINLEPGASVPLHTHPGVETAKILAGTLSVTVGGPALLQRAADDPATPSPVADAPVDEEFKLRVGDQLTYLPETSMTFKNDTDVQVSILASVIQPAGHQHPPGITYIGEQPGQDAFVGVASVIQGDGIAAILPTGEATLTIDRVVLAVGQPLPAQAANTLLSVVNGALSFTVDSGRVQPPPPAGAAAGPQAEVATGTTVEVPANQGFFLPDGVNEAARSDADGQLELLRLTITGSADSATPQAEPGAPAVITIAASAATPVPT
jgi:hypothetical protein